MNTTILYENLNQFTVEDTFQESWSDGYVDKYTKTVYNSNDNTITITWRNYENWPKTFHFSDSDAKEYFSQDNQNRSRWLNRKIKSGLLKQIVEKLNASQPASVWIRDFVDSKNPMFKNKTKKERIAMALGAYYGAQKNEEYGAGFEGTDTLRKRYIKDTPGQTIQQFKTEMKQYNDYQEFATQHKKMYPSHTEVQIQAAYKKYSTYAKMDEASGDSIEKVYNDLAKMHGSALRGILRRIDHPDYNDIKDQDKENIIAEILMFKFGEEEALEFLENPDNFKMEEAQNFVSKSFIEDLLDAATNEQRKNKQLRHGQSIMIALKDMNSKLYSDITGTEYDPFYNDNKISALLKHLNPNWKFSNFDEALKSPGQKFDMKRVNAGAMSRDEYNKKYKLDKYRTGANKLAGPGGIYKNLIKKESAELDETKDHIRSGNEIAEDYNKMIKVTGIETDLDPEESQWKNFVAAQRENGVRVSASGYHEFSISGPLKKVRAVIIKHYGDVKEAEKMHPQIKISMSEKTINIGDYNVTSEKSAFGGYRAKVVGRNGSTIYLSQASYNTPDEAKDHAEDYLKQYASGVHSNNIKVPIKGTYDLKEEKESYDSWIIKPREGNGDAVKVQAPDETSAIEIALGRKPSQNEIDFFNFHFIMIHEKTNVSTLRNMKIVELATNCYDSDLVRQFVEQQYKSKTSALEIKESFRSFVSKQKI